MAHITNAHLREIPIHEKVLDEEEQEEIEEEKETKRGKKK